MPIREVNLRKALAAARNIEDDPNEGSRLQKQIDLLAVYVTAQHKASSAPKTEKAKTTTKASQRGKGS